MKWKKLGVFFGTLVLTAVTGASVSAKEFTEEKTGAKDEYAWMQLNKCYCGKILDAPGGLDCIDHQEHVIEVMQQMGDFAAGHNGYGTAHMWQIIHHNTESHGEPEPEAIATEEAILETVAAEKAEVSSFVDSNGLTWEVENGVLTVSGNGVLKPLWFDEGGFFVSQKAAATSLVIGEGITEIGDKAFADCTNLENVVIPNSVTKIGDSAFEYCKNITKIDIPNHVTEIGESAFERSGLTAISLPSGITEIKRKTFWNCTSLTQVVIPDSVTKIGEEAFLGCRMSELDIPDSVTEISNGAFLYCSELTGVTIPRGVKVIDGLAFGECTSLVELTISNGVTEIGPGAFIACISLPELTIPDSIKRMNYAAFYSCRELKSVTFEGDAPQIIEAPRTGDIDIGGYDVHLLEGEPLGNINLSVTVYYPSGNQTYTEEVKAAYGPYLNWEEPKKEELPFTDVNQGDWYVDAVRYVFSRKIMTGLNATEFGPTVEVSRAQFATILYRLEGEPAVDYDPSAFKDVANGQFYTKAAMWAKNTGVISGYADGGFGPGDNITREQMSVMMFRYAKYRGFDTAARDNLSKFPDKNRVSGFAKDGISWAVGIGLITGDQGRISPQGSAERAQTATIMQRFMTTYGE